jgi:6-pyruvoyl-tetrahydropterin synthase/DNA-binding NarL/FixJ family response regulator
MSGVVRVAVAGDDERTCTLLQRVLARDSDLAVVGRAKNGSELVFLLRQFAPHVVIIDLDAPGRDMVAALRAAKREAPTIKIVALLGRFEIGKPLLGEFDSLLHRDDPLNTLANRIRELGSGKATWAETRVAVTSYSPARAGEALASDALQLFGLYVGDLERRQRELEERLDLSLLWLQEVGGRDQGAGSQLAATLRVEPVTREAGELSYILVVDSFFNAQHKVSIAGKEGTLHPHSWRVSVRLHVGSVAGGPELVGFAEAKRLLRDQLAQLDGKVLNKLPEFSTVPPTTENIAALIFKGLKTAVGGMMVALESVTLWESPTNAVICCEGSP